MEKPSKSTQELTQTMYPLSNQAPSPATPPPSHRRGTESEASTVMAKAGPQQCQCREASPGPCPASPRSSHHLSERCCRHQRSLGAGRHEPFDERSARIGLTPARRSGRDPAAGTSSTSREKYTAPAAWGVGCSGTWPCSAARSHYPALSIL